MKKGYFIPSTVNLKEELIKLKKRRINPTEYEKYCSIIDLMYLFKVVFKKDSKWSSYHSLSTKILNNVLSKKSKEVLSDLVTLNIFEKSQLNYSVGKRCYQYRFHERLWNTKFYLEKIPTDRISNRIKKLNILLSEKNTIDHIGRQHVLESVKNLKIHEYPIRKIIREYEQRNEQEMADYTELILDYFLKEHFYLKADRQGRIYHVLTLCKRSLRKYVRWNWQDLHEIDVPCCQPALLSLLYPERGEEWRKFTNLIKDNKYYNFLNSRLAKPFDLSNKEEKSKLKEIYFSQDLFLTNYVKDSPLRSVIRNEFPILFSLQKEIKKKHHRDLALFLQRTEADIIVNQLCKEFAADHNPNDACLITIHDSLVTTIEHTNEVKERMQNKFDKILGFELQFKIKRITEKI